MRNECGDTRVANEASSSLSLSLEYDVRCQDSAASGKRWQVASGKWQEIVSAAGGSCCCCHFCHCWLIKLISQRTHARTNWMTDWLMDWQSVQLTCWLIDPPRPGTYRGTYCALKVCNKPRQTNSECTQLFSGQKKRPKRKESVGS